MDNINKSLKTSLNESRADNIKLEWCRIVSTFLEIDKDTAAYLYRIYRSDTDLFFGTDNNISWMIDPCIALLMIAAMLNDDGFSKDMYIDIGTRKYRGKRNPYNYSWFEEEDDSGQTALEIIKRWIRNNQIHWNNIFNIVRNNAGITEKTVYELDQIFQENSF